MVTADSSDDRIRDAGDDAPVASLFAASCSNVVNTDITCPKPLLPLLPLPPFRSLRSVSTPAVGATVISDARCWASAIDDAAHAAIANTMDALRIGALLQFDARRLCHGF